MINKIKQIVKEYPNKIAYKINNEHITYEKLWNRAYEYAQFLKKEGTSPVIIYGHKEINTVISILACLIAKRAYVPVGKCTPTYRIKKIINLTNSSLILSDTKLEKIKCIKLNELVKYKNLEEKNQNNDIAYIIFTSGSTGEPKGVPISIKNLNNFINWISNLKPLSDYKEIKVLNQASFSFDLSVADFYYSLCNGHTLVAYDGEINDNKLFKVLSEINLAVLTPTFIKYCLLNEEFNQIKYPNLKCIYSCGEELEVKTAQKLIKVFPNIKIINAYGPTEATSAVSAIQITKEMLDNLKILPVGQINNFATEIKIIDNEIVLKGESVFNGYLSNITGGYYKENNINCYKTGDIGYIKDDKLYCKGRKDNQIKYKGYRIELNEIEYNINQIEGIKECAVIAKYTNEKIVKTIKAYVVANDNIDENYIKKELSKLLPNYMIPKIIEIIETLPINQNGKIDRKALQ